MLSLITPLQETASIPWEFLVTSLLSLVTGGGLTGIFMIKSTKKAKEIENDKSVYGDYREYIELVKSENAALKEERDSSVRQMMELWKTVNELSVKVGDLQQKLGVVEGALQSKTSQLGATETELKAVKAELAAAKAVIAKNNIDFSYSPAE